MMRVVLWTAAVVLLSIAIMMATLSYIGIFGGDWWLEHSGDLVGHVLTILSLFVGVALVNHQLQTGHSSSLELQKQEKRNELNLEIYRSLTEKAEAIGEAHSQMVSYLRRAEWAIDAYLSSINQKLAQALIEPDANELLDLHNKLGVSVVALIQDIERWETSIENFDVFRLAFSSANYDDLIAFQPMFPFAVQLLPGRISHPEIHKAFYARITPDLAENFRAVSHRYVRASEELENFGFDLRVEAQNALVSMLFGRTVARRIPGDPERVVVTVDRKDYARLTRLFTVESALGRANREANEAVRQDVESRSNRAAQPPAADGDDDTQLGKQ